MFRKSVFIILASILASVVFFSCGGGSSSGKAPVVEVVTDSSADNSSGTDNGTVTDAGATTVSTSGNTSGNTSGTTTVNNGSSGTDNNTASQKETNFVLVIRTDNSGNLTINNEEIDAEQYNPLENSSSSITVRDENGNYLTWRIDDNGNLIVVPGDAAIVGTYTVTINTGEREYVLIIKVDADKNASVETAVSFPSGSSIAADLDSGNLVINGEVKAVISSGSAGDYKLDSSILSIVVKNSSGTILESSIDTLTGDIIIAGDYNGPYEITITTTDGRIISFATDSYGKVTGNVSVTGCAVVLDLDNGAVSLNGNSLNLSAHGSSGWYLNNGVEIINATAGDGAITLQSSSLSVDSANGDILVKTDNAVAPAGPYAVTISVDGKLYIIRTDASGSIKEIIPGNILLQLVEGYAVHCGKNIIKIAEQTGSAWGLSGKITSFTASDSNNNSIQLGIDNNSGNIVTPDSASGVVTISFNYTDAKNNIITYVITVINGTVSSFMAEVSEPGPDFDFSTVTNVRISLKVVDSDTGIPVKQASISLDTADKWQGFTDDNGVSVFTATVEAASRTSKILVTHAAYESVEQQVAGLGKLVEFGKNIAMKKAEAVVVTDSDGDGVSDAEDSYPEDPAGAKSITGVYTIAFEDLYPSKGDADFNDLVVRLTLIEKIDSQNKLRQIDIKTKLLASGAGYTNQFWINIGGRAYKLIANPKEVSEYTLGSNYNSKTTEQYRDCAELSHDPVVFENGVSRDDIAPMPYDPYIICNGVTGKEVHLPFVKTTYTGAVLDKDKFPWAILVPENWAWPYESGKISNAYSEFDDWYTSDGLISADWYLRYNSSSVFLH